MNNCNQKVKLLDVIGEGTGQTIIEFKIPLPNPDPIVGNPIIDEKFEIQEIQKHVFRDQVVIQGKLIKNIIYKAFKDQQNLITHQGACEPFMIQVSIPGLRPGQRVGQRMIFSNNPLDDLHLQIHLLNLQSDTQLKLISKEQLCAYSEDDPCVIFRNPALAQRYHGKHAHKITKNKKAPCKKNILVAHEKVKITISVTAAKEKIKTICVQSPEPIFHCTTKKCCKNN